MKGDVKERWQLLCQQASQEQDPERLLELVKEINQLLDEKEQRLRARQSAWEQRLERRKVIR